MASTITLTIQLSQPDLDRIYALDQQIILVRRFEAVDDMAVICVAFEPFGPQNTVTFLPEWAVYASQQSIRSGSTVRMQLQAPVVTGQLHSFFENRFGSPKAAYIANAFGIDNGSQRDLRFGLAQAISINGDLATLRPLTITTIPSNQTSYLRPLTEARIFLASGLAVGQVHPAAFLHCSPKKPSSAPGMTVEMQLPLTIGKPLSVDLASDSTIYFDSLTNCFTPYAPRHDS